MEREFPRGDSPTTAVTNEMADVPGFPAETEDGELVNIVSKEHKVNGVNKLTAEDGRVFREAKRGEVAGLKPYDEEDGKDPVAVVEDEEPVEPVADDVTNVTGEPVVENEQNAA